MSTATKGEYQAVEGGKAEKHAEPFQVQAFPPCSVLLNPFAWLLWLLDFLIWLIGLAPCFWCSCGPVKTFLFCAKRCTTIDSCSDPDPDGDDEDETNRRRNLDGWTDGLLETPCEDEDDAPTTVWEIAERSFNLYADKECFGTRTYLGKEKGGPGQFPKMIFGETKWTDYKLAGQQVRSFGAGLREIGLQPLTPGLDLEKTTGPHTLLIFEDTSQEWSTSLLGAHSQSIVVATSYATLGIGAVVEAMKECSVSAVVCNRKNVAEIQRVAPPCLKTIIYTNFQVDPEEASKPLASVGNVRAISFEELLALGATVETTYPPTPPTPEMLAVIMYTSGSTGKPKGVMIPHSSVAASCGGMKEVLNCKEGEETYLAYLPAAHIFEFCAELSMLLLGAKIGYSDPRTMTSKGAVRQRDDGTCNDQPGWPFPPGGIQEFAPTMMVAVPVVWDTFKKTIEEQVGKQSMIVQWLFQVAYSAAYYARKQGRSCPLLSFLVFRKINKMIGGRLKFGISGGGPISKDVQEFMSTIGGFPLIQGYALTETCCAGTVQDVSDPDPGNVGGPVPSVELKLKSCDGAEDPKDREGEYYLATDEEHLGEACLGRGEVLIRGPSISNGYFKQPELTKKAWDGPPREGGWFHTGDIAYWDTRGRLHIVDRLKNLVKLKGGEYIATENMEKEYSTSPYVRSGITGGIMCYGDGDMRKPVAFVQVNISELKKWAAGAGLAGKTDEALCETKEARKAVLASLNSAGKGKLGNNETLASVRLIPGTGPESGAPSETSPWSAENGCRTASGKLDRKAIQNAHAAMMVELKKEGE